MKIQIYNNKKRTILEICLGFDTLHWSSMYWLCITTLFINDKKEVIDANPHILWFKHYNFWKK